MPRFRFHANAIAVAGRFRRPQLPQLGPHAFCVLPSLGGRVTAKAEFVRHDDPNTGELLVAFDLAETTIEGLADSSDTFTTQLDCVVRNLVVGKALRAGEVRASLRLSYRRGSRLRTVDTEGSAFRGLSLAGRPIEIAVDHPLAREAADYITFRKQHPNLPESGGLTRYSLARHSSLQFSDWDHGYLDETGFGRIYFCEWSAGPHSQSLTMLRIRLGNPGEEELEVGALFGDGSDYP